MKIDEAKLKGNIVFGKYTYTGPNTKVYGYDPNTKLTVGSYCSISDYVTFILGGQHNYKFATTFPFNDTALWEEKPTMPRSPVPYNCFHGDITIGHDVWIGMHTVILSGVTIGNGAVIGAGSVVRPRIKHVMSDDYSQWRGRIPDYAIVMGNPAIIVGYRFDGVDFIHLENMKWWDWPEDKIKIAVERGLLQSEDIKALNKFYEEEVK